MANKRDWLWAGVPFGALIVTLVAILAFHVEFFGRVPEWLRF